MPLGNSKNLRNHSALHWANNSTSSHPSAPATTPQMVMVMMSSRLCRLPCGLLGSSKLLKCSTKLVPSPLLIITTPHNLNLSLASSLDSISTLNLECVCPGWGPDDQKGAVNMVDDAKRLRAAGLIKSGRAVSLSREFPVTPAPNNPSPAIHYMRKGPREPGGGMSTDYYGISYHGTATTHLDALCHVERQKS